MLNPSYRSSPLQMRYHREPLDLLALIGVQECIVVAERYAAVGIAPWAKHVGMGEQTGAAQRAVLIDRTESDRLHAVERRFAHFQIVECRRRRTVHSLMDVPRIIEPQAEAVMRLQLCAVRHVNSVSRNIIDGGEAIVASGRNIYSVAGGAVFRRGVSERNRPRLAEQPLENGRRIGVGLSGI